MHETALLRRIYEASRGLRGDVVVGPGDDCAVVRVGGGGGGGSLLLLTVDQLIEHRHYVGPLVGGPTAVDLVARKAVARSVSDIAAMAGLPRWALATAGLPAGFPQGVAEELFERMRWWAGRFGCPLVGGDLAETVAGAPAVLTVTVGGEPHALRGPVLRSGARAGDGVWMTGRVGGSLPSGRHLTFEPRVREAAWLAEALGERLHAMIDLSDGLGRDAARVAEASGVRIELEGRRLPVHEAASATAAADGEDYELLFTVEGEAELPAACPATGTALTRIGRVVAGQGCVLEGEDGVWWNAGEMAWGVRGAAGIRQPAFGIRRGRERQVEWERRQAAGGKRQAGGGKRGRLWSAVCACSVVSVCSVVCGWALDHSTT